MERKMKNQSENVWGGSQLSYEAPRVDLIQVAVEKGFAQSSFEGDDNDTGASLTGGNAWQ
jgi:hypothetical protein